MLVRPPLPAARGPIRIDLDWDALEIAVAFHEYEIEAPENAIMDDAQLVFLGLQPEKMPQARTAVDRHMTRFRLSSGLCRYPLAVQIFTARNPAL